MENNSFSKSGKIIDVVNKKIFPGTVFIENGIIAEVKEGDVIHPKFILPGLIDAHVHIESSMLVPSEFARQAVTHGTVGTVSDPHEIANVLGVEGINFMINNGDEVPFKFHFGAPSCVPATEFENAGAHIDAEKIKQLLKREDIHYLSEVMNFPGVINDVREVWKKIKYSHKYKKNVDGHAPGLTGEGLKKYIAAGITTDHECITLQEAEEKLALGMKILIREGSAAKNFDELAPLIKKHPDKVMLCTDDIHPDNLIKGHINKLIKNGFTSGIDKMDMLRSATYNPVIHYNLDVGLLQKGDPADFILVDNLNAFTVLETYINGIKVYGEGKVRIDKKEAGSINRFNREEIEQEELKIPSLKKNVKIIEAKDGKLYTNKKIEKAKISGGYIIQDLDRDILKIVVLNRYDNAPPALGLANGFGLKRGAMASSIAHDSHNIIAVGANDGDLTTVINHLINSRGGIAVCDNGHVDDLKLPVAGLMTDMDGQLVAKQYRELNKQVKRLGSRLSTPLMTLSFMALLVIPELKMSDKGLFDVNRFNFTSLYAGNDS